MRYYEDFPYIIYRKTASWATSLANISEPANYRLNVTSPYFTKTSGFIVTVEYLLLKMKVYICVSLTYRL